MKVILLDKFIGSMDKFYWLSINASKYQIIAVFIQDSGYNVISVSINPSDRTRIIEVLNRKSVHITE